MSKKTKQLITLVAVTALIGGLVAVYFGIEARQEREAAAAAAEAAEMEAPATQTFRLIEQSEAELERATFESDSYSFIIEAERDDDGNVTWLYTGDHDVELDQSATRNMMRDVFMLTAADRVMEAADNPADFGIGRVVVTGYFRDGSRSVIRLGMLTPDHRQFYAMVDDDPALYLITSTQGNRLIQNVSDLVNGSLPFIEVSQLIYVYVGERDRPALEFGWGGTDEELENAVTQFGGTWLTMIAPYPGRDLHMSNLEMIALEDFQGFAPNELVEMFPSDHDLVRFGMDDPLLQVIMEDANGSSFHLIFGDNHDDEYIYMMYGDRPHVWTVERGFIEGFLGLNPFNLIDRFVALFNILNVERIVIGSEDRGNHEMFINNFQDESERDQIAPVVNGQEIQDGAFRSFYQSLISISYEHEIGVQEDEDMGTPSFTVTYHLLDENEPSVTVEFFVYDSNFYAVRQYPNPVEFVTSRLAVDVLFSAIDSMLAGELDR